MRLRRRLRGPRLRVLAVLAVAITNHGLLGSGQQSGLASAADVEESSCAAGAGEGECASTSSSEAVKDVRWKPKTLSVVLPCASEGEFAFKTAKAVAESVPDGQDVLSEIIIVDDGSRPPVRDAFPEGSLDEMRVRIVRHEKPKGLIQAKAAGGNVAKGDVIVFFDCHVAPQPGWHKRFLKSMAKNYRRIVVPTITDLDIDTWQQKPESRPMSKCYLTWDSDFKWFSSESDYIPILSGGLLGISSRWWKETGGYDKEMLNWGGENIDQSLRTWLCGGEIVAVPKAQVAHMWRSNDDKRTQARYSVVRIHTLENRARAAKGWFGNFTAKLDDYPDMAEVSWRGMDVSAFHEVQRRLGCKPFAWFLWRFRDVYEDAGMVPAETFRIRHIKSGKCLTYMGPAGTHPEGKDQVSLAPCGAKVRNSWHSSPPDPQRWHLANRDPKTSGCCSGLRAWNTDQCIGFAGLDHVASSVCWLSGRMDQLWGLSEEGQAGLSAGQLFHQRGYCIYYAKGGKLKIAECKERKGGKAKPTWEKIDPEVPLERKLYMEARAERPELFVDT